MGGEKGSKPELRGPCIILWVLDETRRQEVDHWIDDWIEDHASRAWWGTFSSDWASDNTQALFRFVNDVAFRVGERFLEGDISFETADRLANSWFIDLLPFVEKGQEWPEPAWSVYLAFDAGEVLPSDIDPVEDGTIPQLREVQNRFRDPNEWRPLRSSH